jgi:hypothetical protein
MSTHDDRLFDLLPAVYRLRDGARGFPLRALLRVIAEQVDIVEDDITRLYDNWFVETCDDWAVPYIGDLIGYEPVHEAGDPGDLRSDAERRREKILVPRREVANTIRNRRRKGTLAVLETLARETAGWPTRVIELYRELGWTQHLNFLHPHRGRLVDLRNDHALDLLETPFDHVAHTADIARRNIPGVAVFVWRLKSYPVTWTQARCIDNRPNCYSLSILGNDAPLFTRPQREADPAEIATELDVPVPIRRRVFEVRDAHGNAYANPDYYGPGKSIEIRVDHDGKCKTYTAGEIIPADLSHWHYHPPPGKVALDPQLGRLAFRAEQSGDVWVRYQYGFSADIGGGEYERPMSQPEGATVLYVGTDDVESCIKPNPGQPDPDERRNSPLYETIDEAFKAAHAARQVADEMALAGLGNTPAAVAATIRARAEAYTQEPAKAIAAAVSAAAQTAADTVGATADGVRKAAAAAARDKKNVVIEITDSRLYEEKLSIKVPEGVRVQLRAANRKRPVLQIPDRVSKRDAFRVELGKQSHFTLDGLLIGGRAVHIRGVGDDSCPPTVVIKHCTLVPGWAIDAHCRPSDADEPSLELRDSSAHVRIEHSILGSIEVSQNEALTDPVPISISDSVVDATGRKLDAISGTSGCSFAFATLDIARTTVIGHTHAHAIRLAEDSIFYGHVEVARRQIGCVRFCYVPPKSRTPRRYECQPDLVVGKAAKAAEDEQKSKEEKDAAEEAEARRVEPRFNSTRYGLPVYCQLSLDCAPEITAGAADDSEMGLFHDLFQPQRAANLRVRFNEHVPASADVHIDFAS